ncbi:unnamed protein product [Brassica oleracea var. botrytis]|uniref:Uncharacterized protein n=3 Tax=Brassica TaxID=3705 RepID=A0A0D3CB03_BRAOL|nr:unnamed protein product [Brassica napus]CDY48484.1 BnaC05g13440D [Brassica napus]
MSAMKRYLSVALVLLLIAFFSSKYSVEGRSLSRMTNSSQAMRDFQTRKDMKEAKPLVGENDSLRRRVPRSGSNPIQNKCIKCNRPIVAEGSRKQQITTARKP